MGFNQKKLLIICATLCVLWCVIISALGLGSLIMAVVSLARHSETSTMYPTCSPSISPTMYPTMIPTMGPTEEIPQ